ncbi:S41 family peptidase [Candidatus Parcubacteria bacterium]|nr:MAG: S41 family peptidase [Candidatus Parcubacteria bacterium]
MPNDFRAAFPTMTEKPGSQKLKVALAVFVLLLALGSAFLAGYGLGQAVPKEVVVRGIANISNNDVKADFSTFWEVWNLINKSFLFRDRIDPAKEVQGAIRGLVDSLGDRYSEFFAKEDNQQFQEDLEGKFGGVGMEIGIRKGKLVVIAPLDGTPADRSGIRAGDRILLIDATPTDNLSLTEAVHLIRGPVGSKVRLTIDRDSWEEPKEVVITRDTITIPTLDFAMKDQKIAYLHLRNFNANAPSLFFDAVQKMTQAGAKGLVLDLRNDPGGFLDVAVDLAGWFLPDNTMVVKEENMQGKGREFRSSGEGILKNVPTVILINEGSASAAEILAGALHVHLGIPLVGVQSFGKGTVQELIPLHDGSAVKLTVAHWVLPDGRILSEEGLTPDVEVKLTDKDIDEGRDPQLEKALELVREKIAAK